MKLKKFYGEIDKNKYPESNDYITIQARTIKEAREICEKTVGDLISNVQTKKPEEPFKMLCILTSKGG